MTLVRRGLVVRPLLSLRRVPGGWLTRQPFSFRHLSSSFPSSGKNRVTLGIARETYNTWERRVPLTPHHVQNLLLNASPSINNSSDSDSDSDSDSRIGRVLVQPCAKRVFENQAYEEVGAILSEDLAEADVILAVKRPTDPSTLIPHKTYLFFSHVIKGQPQNMDLLQTILDKKIQLLDYEKILEQNTTDPHDHQQQARRLVSFGRFAGLAGAIDLLHGLGRRLHQEGKWTPFSSFPQTIYKDGLDDARARLQKLAHRIAQSGIPQLHEPLVVAVTGKGGAVHGGVMEILKMLPHEIVHKDQLPTLFSSSNSSGEGEQNRNKIYILPLAVSDMFERNDGKTFDRLDFAKSPHAYRSNFTQDIAPYVHAVANCAYWDPRFPRIMTRKEAKDLFRQGKNRFRLLSDISCDVNGSFEFLEKTTSIEKPFFQYNPLTEEVVDDVTESGITVNGVDILPSQLPREASIHFGDKLFPVVQEIAKCFDHERKGVDVNKLSKGVLNACITTPSGMLEEDYRYLERFLKKSDTTHTTDDRDTMVVQNTMVLRLWGHLFDTGLINLVLDAGVNRDHCNLTIEDAAVPLGPAQHVMSSLTLRVTTDQGVHILDEVEAEIRRKLEHCVDAQATMSREDVPNETLGNSSSLPSPGEQSLGSVDVQDTGLRKILLLGSGYVAKSAVKFLDQHTLAAIQVASNKEAEARDVASAAKVSSYYELDVVSNRQRLSELVRNADIVLSLLPATMHTCVAEECLVHGKNLVTCSYTSDEMWAMEESVMQKGLVFLNEVGLDPGLDHMSAMRLIDDIKERNGQVIRFSSVCGGLPSPGCAGYNPLGYKFSWSPAGVLRASRQDALYRLNGQTISVKGEDLLASAVPFRGAWPELDLDVLPNRNSLAYQGIYGLEHADTLFRGTLRYRGFAPFMRFFSNAGLMTSSPVPGESWNDVLKHLAAQKGFTDLWEFYRFCSSGDSDLAGKALVFMNHLGLTGSRRPSADAIDASFCKVLESKLSYGRGEFDMVLMHHDIGAVFEDGSTETHNSTLRLVGDSEGSAMAKTVGYTAGAAVILVLEGGLEGSSGVLLPTIPSIYKPVLTKVGDAGIVFEEEVFVKPAAH